MTSHNGLVTATLLLADDSVTIQRVIELTFADEDVDVVAFSDGDSAIAQLDREPPDIVLADVGMTGRSGYEVARYIRQTPRLAHIPVLLLTGAFEPVDRQKAADVGCDGVLVKPFEPQVVIGRVKELLARPRSATTTSMAVSAAFTPEAAWTFPEVAVPAATTGDVPASSASAGEFFDQLDAALAALPGTRADAPDPVDHFRSEESAALSAAPEPAAAPSPAPQSATTLPPTQSMPSLAEAFTVLLAAEQPGGASVDLAAWAPPVPAPVVSDDLVERVAERVLGRLSAEVLRETIAELVSTTAERLIREEIERIKASIK